MALFSGMGSQLPTEKMMSSAATGDVAGLKEALAEGADPNYRRTDLAPLLLTINRGHEECAIVILEQTYFAVNVNVKNSMGWRPLHEAIRKGMSRAFELLIENGAIVTSRDDDGTAPLRVAIDEGRLEMATRLLDEGASVDTTTLLGVTPLMAAVEKRDMGLIDLLIDRGADPLLQDHEHKSAVDRATGWVEGEARFQALRQAQQEAADLLTAAKAQDVGLSTIAKRRRPS